MTQRYSLLAIAIALAFTLSACAGGGGAPAREPPAAPPSLTVEVLSRPSPPRTSEDLTWVIAVTNRAQEPVTIAFNTTQRADVLLERAGARIYTWSQRRSFPLREDRQEIRPGQTVTFELEDDVFAVAPGEYQLYATVSSVPRLASQLTTIRVEPAVR